MINWITNNLATAAKSEVNENGYKIVDVRDMLDKKGNPAKLILEKIGAAIELIKSKHKVVICCDYGLSRSNSVAIGVLVKHLNWDFDKAARTVLKKTGKALIELGLLNSVRTALGETVKKPDRKTILITGAEGLVGSALCGLLKSKYRLVVPEKPQTGPIELDLLVKKFAPGLIIHLADPEVRSTNKAMAEMILNLKNVLDVCRGNKIPIIFPSSLAVFSGYKGKKVIADSSLSPKPGDNYGQAKFLCEVLLSKSKEVKAAVIRFGSIYGPKSGTIKFIYNFVQKAKKDLPIYTHKYKNGFPVLDLINVKDAALAIESVMKKKFSGTINIGSGTGLSTFEIAQKIKKACGSKSKVVFWQMDGSVANIVADSKEAKRFLGWSPKIAFDKGLKEIINYGS